MRDLHGRRPPHRGGTLYLRDEAALRHGAGPEADTPHSREAYAPFPPWQPGPPANLDGHPWA